MKHHANASWGRAHHIKSGHGTLGLNQAHCMSMLHYVLESAASVSDQQTERILYANLHPARMVQDISFIDFLANVIKLKPKCA